VSRVVAVLGYSRKRDGRLHRICAERVARAEELSAGAGAVVFSGTPEAELMRDAWNGPRVELICEPASRSTAQNARNLAALVQTLGATEVVAVTSRWHRRRASLLLRSAFRGSGVHVSVESHGGSSGRWLVARELACFVLLPLQLARRRRRRVAQGPAPPPF